MRPSAYSEVRTGGPLWCHVLRPLGNYLLFAATDEDALARLLQDEARIAEGAQAETPLHRAASFGPTSEVRELLRAGGNPNARDEDALTPLHRAAMRNPDPVVIRLLIAAGADANARNLDSFTPLHLAGANPSAEVVRALIQAGANPQRARAC